MFIINLEVVISNNFFCVVKGVEFQFNLGGDELNACKFLVFVFFYNLIISSAIYKVYGDLVYE